MADNMESDIDQETLDERSAEAAARRRQRGEIEDIDDISNENEVAGDGASMQDS